MLLSLELKACRALWSVDMVFAEASTGLLGKGTIALVLRHTCWREAATTEEEGGSRLGNQYGRCTVYQMWFCVYAEAGGGWGPRDGVSQFFCSWSGITVLAALREALSEERIFSLQESHSLY